jgi:hypothetical protein
MAASPCNPSRTATGTTTLKLQHVTAPPPQKQPLSHLAPRVNDRVLIKSERLLEELIGQQLEPRLLARHVPAHQHQPQRLQRRRDLGQGQVD